MLSSFIALLLIISKYQVQSQNGDVCIWGRRGWYSVLNGAYTYRGLYNDAPWYSKNIHPSWGQHGFNNVTYLWRNNRNYTLSDYPPSSTSNIYHAFCQSASLHVYDCDRNWRFTDSMTNDMGMFAQNGSCPFWDCDQIITSGITFTWAIKCEGPFDVKIAPNVWRNSQSMDEYWYFHETTFQWVCAASYDLQPWSSLWEWSEPGWYDTSKGSTIWVNFTNYQNVSHLQQVDCIIDPTVSPTNHPTFIPTTYPTKHPVVKPTNDPTLIPTTYPTNNPTSAPTYIPTSTPTRDVILQLSTQSTRNTQNINDVIQEMPTTAGNVMGLQKYIIVVLVILFCLVCLISVVLVYILCRRPNRLENSANYSNEIVNDEDDAKSEEDEDTVEICSEGGETEILNR
eukprot:262083_1